jgi:hypothetical protein
LFCRRTGRGAPNCQPESFFKSNPRLESQIRARAGNIRQDVHDIADPCRLIIRLNITAAEDLPHKFEELVD